MARTKTNTRDGTKTEQDCRQRVNTVPGIYPSYRNLSHGLIHPDVILSNDRLLIDTEEALKSRIYDNIHLLQRLDFNI